VCEEYPPVRIEKWHWIDTMNGAPLQFTDIFSRDTGTGVEGAPSFASKEKGREFAETDYTESDPPGRRVPGHDRQSPQGL